MVAPTFCWLSILWGSFKIVKNILPEIPKLLFCTCLLSFHFVYSWNQGVPPIYEINLTFCNIITQHMTNTIGIYLSTHTGILNWKSFVTNSLKKFSAKNMLSIFWGIFWKIVKNMLSIFLGHFWKIVKNICPYPRKSICLLKKKHVPYDQFLGIFRQFWPF